MPRARALAARDVDQRDRSLRGCRKNPGTVGVSRAAERRVGEFFLQPRMKKREDERRRAGRQPAVMMPQMPEPSR